MKTLALLLILAISGHAAFTQNEKCLSFSNKIVENMKGKILCNSTNDDIYCMKAGFPEKYDLEAVKTICDTTAKATKVSVNWHLNYDKNYEKEYVINGKKILITIYFNDKFLYFEFPKL
jgi:hypothetical protein